MAATPEGNDAGEDAALRARLRVLSESLDTHGQAKGSAATKSGVQGPSGMGQAMSLGFRVMSEFVAAVVVAAFIGWAIDRGLGSSPLALILFLALGTAAGFWNVYRIAAKRTARPPGGL